MIAFPSPLDFVLPLDILLHEDMSSFDPSSLPLINLYKCPLDKGGAKDWGRIIASTIMTGVRK
jgi:hypothetical protein